MTVHLIFRAEVRQLVTAVAARHGVGPRDIYEPCRMKHVVAARYDCIRAVASRYPTITSPRLARIFRRDHTSILYALGRLRSKKPRSMGFRQ